MSHTPGPWVIVSDDEGRCFINSGGVIKAVVATCDQPVSAEHAANARLIAAAPDLLEALEAALNDLDHAYNGAENFAVLAKSKARAAIAKARET